jgi:uncharacterized protein GlcG (DUF336 family)
MSRPVTLDVAQRLVSAAVEEAGRRGARVSAAVVDGGGHLLAFARMDGAEIAGPTLAVDKAYTAVAQSTSTEELGVLAAPGGALFGLQANGSGRYVIFGGGVPLRTDGVIVGGVGVSGSTVEDDVACAQHAVRLFTESLS